MCYCVLIWKHIACVALALTCTNIQYMRSVSMNFAHSRAILKHLKHNCIIFSLKLKCVILQLFDAYLQFAGSFPTKAYILLLCGVIKTLLCLFEQADIFQPMTCSCRLNQSHKDCGGTVFLAIRCSRGVYKNLFE